jgi:NAD(P)-dependent dehydrogenase (short-subunit alcohol dehydrogenase family)
MTSRRVILVTGCSTGIGAHCARRLRDEGFAALSLELRDPASIEACFREAMSRSEGRLDAVFNNAGYAQPGAVEDLSVEALREQMEVNVFGAHQLTRLALSVMRQQGHGRIVNCSSVLGRVPMPWRAAYSASKYALGAMTVTLRQELLGSDIHASLIEPGPIPSSLAANALDYVERYIDVDGSVHRAHYATRLDDLRAQAAPADLSGAEPVYKALNKALTARRPAAHYPVTRETWLALAACRILPRNALYRLLAATA